MNSEIEEGDGTTESELRRGWIFYDGECEFCRNFARLFERAFNRRGFDFAPFQSPRVAQKMGVPWGARPSEMRVTIPDGRYLGGADAVVFLSGFIWWGRPLSLVARFPGAKPLLRRLYHEIAARRSCDDGLCRSPELIRADHKQ